VGVAWSLESTWRCCHRLHKRLEDPGGSPEQVGSLIGSLLHGTGRSEPHRADGGDEETARQSTGRDWTDVVHRTACRSRGHFRAGPTVLRSGDRPVMQPVGALGLRQVVRTLPLVYQSALTGRSGDDVCVAYTPGYAVRETGARTTATCVVTYALRVGSPVSPGVTACCRVSHFGCPARWLGRFSETG
jgi:hypothetical protein